MNTHFYPDLIDRLFQINLVGGMKLGLQNVQRLQLLLDFPDHSFASIHIAGTNGKGSVSTKIAEGFQLAGYRVGLYTSPHISTFRERIRINGTMISEEAVEELLPSLFRLTESENIPATFFELTTFLAFLYFTQEKVDVAVLETGLGGRLDATNVVVPHLSIITSISLDHTDILGSSKESIAFEKGGIIKEKIPVIIGPHVPFELIHSIALQKNSQCIQVKERSPLFEEENVSIARAALEHLAQNFRLPGEAIEKGLKAKPPCRFEIHQGPPLTIIDVAHNPDGLKRLFQMLAHHYPNHPLRFLFGLSKNKDVEGCLKLFAGHAACFHLVEAVNGRGAAVRTLADYLGNLGVNSNRLFSYGSIGKGVREAQEAAAEQGEILVICGSFFIMSEVRRALGFDAPSDHIDLNERNMRLK